MNTLSIPSPPSLDQVQALLQTGTPPHVSLFMPTRRPWNQTKQNQLTLGGLIDEAEAALQRDGRSASEARALLAPARALVDDESFWGEMADGLAVYTSRSSTSTHVLPFAVPEQQFVDRRFHVRPLLRSLTPDGPFYLLALSQGGVRLYRGSRYTFESVPLENVATTLDEALQFDEPIRSVTFHTRSSPNGPGTPGRRDAMYHGHGDAGDKAYVKEGILRFLRPLDNEVRRLLGQHATPPPLVLAGVATLRGLYRKVNHYPHLTDTDVDGHFVDAEGTFDANALHEQGWAVVQPHYAATAADDRDRLGQLLGTERATKSLHALVAAAYAHRIDTLFVDAESQAWGRYTPGTHTVEIHTAPEPDDIELLNAAAAWTLQGGGTVHVVAPEAVPGRTPAAALFRF